MQQSAPGLERRRVRQRAEWDVGARGRGAYGWVDDLDFAVAVVH